MFNRITGVVVSSQNGMLYLEAPPLEWSLQISQNTREALPAPGEQATLLLYLHHREDALALYGFAAEEERQLFLELIKVSGIGPGMALKILSEITPKKFLLYLEQEDITSLCRIKGLGKKTAQKILLQLKGALVMQEEDPAEPNRERIPLKKELTDSLISMGFEGSKVRKVIEKLWNRPEIQNLKTASEKEKEILRNALVELNSL